MIQNALRWSIAGLMILPFLILTFFLGQWELADPAEIFRALKFSFLQSLYSAVISVSFGILGALGLNYWQRHAQVLRNLALLPNFVPPLFVMIAVFQVVRPFPFGLTGIVLINSIINGGLCSVIIHSIMIDKVSGWAELALVEGASRASFLYRTLGFLKRDIFLVGFFVFCLCFSSLSVPLLAGRFDSASLELLIYEKISLGESWNEVLGLSVLQTLIVFILGLSLKLPATTQKSRRHNLSLLQWRWGILPVTVCSAVLIFEVLWALPDGYLQLSRVGWGSLGLVEALKNTFSIGLGTGLLVFVLGVLICYSLPHKYFEKFLSAYVAPSTALTAFSFLLLDQPYPLFLVILALGCLFLPVVYRLNVSSRFRGIQEQVRVAQVLGAGPAQILWHISLPQTAKALGLAAGLASFWAVGDFAVSGILLNAPTLALTGKKLMESYRIEAASFFVLIILCVGSLFLFLFWGLGHVVSQRPLSRLRRF